jgi:hypothetical protein
MVIHCTENKTHGLQGTKRTPAHPFPLLAHRLPSLCRNGPAWGLSAFQPSAEPSSLRTLRALRASDLPDTAASGT